MKTNNEQDEQKFLFVIISRYRMFLMKYLNVTKTELLDLLGKRMNKNPENLHLKKIKELNTTYEILEELKVWKCELTGSRNLPKKVNPRDYAKKQLGVLKMKVVEIFNSIDGEGKRTGELTTFIRLWGCNLRCGYCDTKYSYEQESEKLPYKEMAIEEIIKECDKYDTDNITLTGGEPLIHLDVKYLLRALSDAGYNVNVETNGSVPLKQYFNPDGTPAKGYENVWFTVDYKCPSSGMEDKMCMDNFTIKGAIRKYRNVVYKFVVGTEHDLRVMNQILNTNILDDQDLGNMVYISPIYGQITGAKIVEFMQQNKLFNAYTPIRVQLQLHKYLWDVNKRGV